MRIHLQSVAALQDTIHRLAAAGGGEILVGPGRHPVERGIRLKSNIHIRGCGKDATWFVPADPQDFDEPFFSVDEGDSPATENLTLSDFSIDGMFTPDRQAYPEHICRDFKKLEELGARHWRMGVYLTDEFAGTPFRNVTVRNVDVLRCANGMHILSSDGVRISNGRFSGNGCVIQHHHNLYFRRCRNVHITDVELSHSPHGVGLNLGNGCAGFTMERSSIHDNGYRGVRFDGLENLSTDIRLRDCVIHGNCRLYPGEPALRLHTIKGFEITGNVFFGNDTERDLVARLCRQGRIADNLFLGRPAETMEIAKDRNVVVEGNDFRA